MTSSLLFRQDLSDADLAATDMFASEEQRRGGGGGGPATPFQLPFPPFVAFGSDAGEASLRSNCSLFEFLRQHQQRSQPLNYAPSLAVDDGRHALGRTSPFRCVICLAVFPSAWLLEQHNSLQHSIDSRNSETGSPGEDKPFKCEQCGQNYRYRSSYLKHQEQNHRPKVPGDKLFTCDVCGMQFRYLKSFKKHRLNHALEKLHTKSPHGDATVRNNGVLDKYLSRTGEESLTDLGSATAAAAAAAAEKPIRHYPLTDVTMANGSGTESGRVTAPPSTGTGNGGHDCRSVESGRPPANAGAERSASAPAGSAESAATRASGEPRAPDYRPAKPAAASAIDRFSDSDDQEEAVDSLAFALADADASGSLRCRRDSPLLSLLRMNSAERNRETKFSCPFCAKCVRSKENLKLHIRKHTGERPFVCLFCGRAFGGKSDLTRHLRIHTGERPYHCEMCGKCFARADYLSKHLTTHVHSHNARPCVARPTP